MEEQQSYAVSPAVVGTPVGEGVVGAVPAAESWGLAWGRGRAWVIRLGLGALGSWHGGPGGLTGGPGLGVQQLGS